MAQLGSAHALGAGGRRFESGRPDQGAAVVQLVEHQPSKLRVASSSLVSRSSVFFVCTDRAHIAQLVERILGKDEVTSSTLVVGSSCVAI